MLLCIILCLIVIGCFMILMFSTRTRNGGGLQNPPKNIPMPKRK